MEDIANVSKNLLNIKNRPFLLLKKVMKLLKFFCVLLLILFSLQSCSIKPSHPEGEKRVLDKFFRYLLLNESGIYTLIGSKPATDVWIYCESKEEKRKRWESLSEEEKQERILIINEDNPEDIAFYKNLPKKLRKNAFVVPDKDYVRLC